tara:strand:+ start:4170 stop:5051 length:882 start_codon:yes stop_codon:yes gene_type:complete
MSILVFGDSFIGAFNLINDNNLKIHKFTGATMKGLGKIDNENRNKIITITNKNKNNKCLVFNFGQVDLYFSYYYTKFVTKKEFDMTSIIKNYIEFINGLDCNNCNKVIFAVYPTTIEDKDIFDVLISYGILSKKEVESISDSDKKRVSNFNFRYNLYSKFNKLLEKYCKLYKITFINMDNILLNNNKKLKSIFLDPISKFNIHLLWEPIIPIIISKMVGCNCKINKKYKVNLKKTFSRYIKQKKQIMMGKNIKIINRNKITKRKMNKRKITKKKINKRTITKRKLNKKKSRYS